jgi:dihydrofolate synthase/folylpolyglutamate synthase
MLARLGAPQQRYRALHVAGTNGKGSTAAMVAAMLRAAGWRVGLYTSPHLVDFRERICVDGLPIAEDAVAELTGRLRDVQASLSPTFFEFTTAMALQHFADAVVDVAVVEVGMGGRFDATNVIVPLVSAITNIALDHQQFLGSSVESIAFEKAGIIKAGVPVVTGRLCPEAARVVERVAGERMAPVSPLNAAFVAIGQTPDEFRYDGIQASYRDLSCPLLGAHQLDNAACALAIVELAAGQGLTVSEDAVRAGLAAVSWEGRLEFVEQHPAVLLDGAHNPAAARVVEAFLSSYRARHPNCRVILVLGMMRDKDRTEFLHILLPVAHEVVLTQAQVPRAASVQELGSSVEAGEVPIHLVPLPADALAFARRLASSQDLICVTGSLMLVGEVKALLRGCGLSPIRG